MDADQTAISLFLKQWPDEFISRKEICRRAGGKWRFREDEHWAAPVLSRMLDQRVDAGVAVFPFAARWKAQRQLRVGHHQFGERGIGPR